MPARKTQDQLPLRVLPLGGLGEIGKNMMVVEYGNDIVVIDAGVLFPEVDMPGIDVVIPNMDYLAENADRVRAILITHGHEDHIGAVPHLLNRLNVPIYAPRMALELIRNKLKNAGLLSSARLNLVTPGKKVAAGDLTVEWFDVCHSIPDACGIAIDTPLGKVIHTGDFKLDHDPMIGAPSDLGHLARIASDGVFLLMSDSTYAEEEGYSDSDRVVTDGLFSLISDAPARVIVSSFASQIARIQIVADAAEAYGRKLVIVGRSMVDNTKLARELGHLRIADNLMISPAQAESMPGNRIIVLTTGSQGEPSSGLVRMSRDQHREINIREDDTIILSANTIPGNEVGVNDSINDLVQLGARVITNRQANTHVSGHARREELRLVLNLARPKYFVPIHGEFRMLKAHADLAADQGVNPENSIVLTDGDVLELTPDRAEIVDREVAGHIYVHGLGLWDENGNVVVERRSLAREGIVTVSVAVDRKAGKVVGQPKLISMGFVHAADAESLFDDTRVELQPILDRFGRESMEWNELESLIRNTVGRYLTRRTKRRPLVIPVAIDI
ncbi:MAG: ribonuclease J [Chloroflexi bacterium]|nr:ribonuclease J [Chloroflexota bacterium]MDA1297385.1 ribonuclease J [Chloroflexota bacterium]